MNYYRQGREVLYAEGFHVFTAKTMRPSEVAGIDELIAAANATERMRAALQGLVGLAAMEEFGSVEAHIANDEEWDLTVTAGAMREAFDAVAALTEGTTRMSEE